MSTKVICDKCGDFIELASRINFSFTIGGTGAGQIPYNLKTQKFDYCTPCAEKMGFDFSKETKEATMAERIEDLMEEISQEVADRAQELI